MQNPDSPVRDCYVAAHHAHAAALEAYAAALRNALTAARANHTAFTTAYKDDFTRTVYAGRIAELLNRADAALVVYALWYALTYGRADLEAALGAGNSEFELAFEKHDLGNTLTRARAFLEASLETLSAFGDPALDLDALGGAVTRARTKLEAALKADPASYYSELEAANAALVTTRRALLTRQLETKLARN